MPPGIEGLAVPHHHVDSGVESTQRPVAALCQAVGRFFGTLHQRQDVEVAVPAAIASGPGTKQVDPLRPEGLDQPADDLAKQWLLFEQWIFGHTRTSSGSRGRTAPWT